tara:strand:- start:1298 stop:2356 length:1059 start_codon:yes stop_codon:yes gene_type:complete
VKYKHVLIALAFFVFTIGTVQAYEGIAEARNSVILLAGEDESGVATGMGSAFFVSADGLALTNYHVIHGTEILRAWLYDEEDMNYYWVEVKAIDPVADLALVKVNLPEHKIPVPYLQVENDLEKMEVGSDVNAIGHMLGLSWTVSKGVINHINRPGLISPYVHIIQHTAHINRGNSGGPLINSEGRVVGVNTYVLSPKGSWTGVAYATRGDDVAYSLSQMTLEGKVSRPALRLKIGFLNEWRRKELLEKYPDAHIPNTFGLIVAAPIEEESWGAKHGIRHLDTIVAINGIPVNNMDQLDAMIKTKKPGDIIILTVIRDNHFILVSYEMAEMDFEEYIKFYDEREAEMNKDEQ